MVLILSNDEIRELLNWSECVRLCEDLLFERAAGAAWFVPRERFLMPTRTALLLLPGGSSHSSCMGARLYSQAPADQNKQGPGHVNVVFDMANGDVLAVTAGDWINVLRTVATGAVGAKHLARKDTTRLGIFGTGMLALGSLLSLREVFNLESAKVFSRSEENRQRFCSKASDMVGFPVAAASAPDEVLEEADIIVTATRSLEPVFDGRLLREGTHVTCLGGHVQAGGRELDEHAITRFDVLAVLDKGHARYGGAWDDQRNAVFAVPVEKGLITWEQVVDLADIMVGRAKGRERDTQVTLFDSRGIGAFDVALAHRAYQLAKDRGIGTPVDWGAREPGWFADRGSP